MRYRDTKDFRKALAKVPKVIQLQVVAALENIEEATTFADISNMKTLKGHPVIIAFVLIPIV